MKGLNCFNGLLLICVLLLLSTTSNGAFVTPQEATLLRDEVQKMFYHAFDGYMGHAFPLDELRPLSCTRENTLGGYALKLVDASDTLTLFGDREIFTAAIQWLGKNLHFDKINGNKGSLTKGKRRCRPRWGRLNFRTNCFCI